MKKISIYSRSFTICPASYYRINQYCTYLNNDFYIKKRCALPDCIYSNYLLSKHRSNYIRISYALFAYLLIYFRTLGYLIQELLFYKPDTIFICRTIIPRKIFYIHTFLINNLLKKSYVIWDFDDNIFESNEIPSKELEIFVKHVDKILVTNNYLRNQLPLMSESKFVYLPTTDGDIYYHFENKLLQNRKEVYKNELVLIWVASASNLPYIREIIPFLDSAARNIKFCFNKKLTLKVVCNVPLDFPTEFLNIDNVIWSRYIAIEEMKNAHIGIMPLQDSTFTRGKGAFKIIQYMSIGLPVIASAVGYNNEVVTPDIGELISSKSNEWENVIIRYANDWDTILSKGINARNNWLNKYSFVNNLNVIKNILNNENNIL